MPIQDIQPFATGLSDKKPRLVFMQTTDTMATAIGAGYLNNAQQNFGYAFSANDMVLLKASDGIGVLGISISGGNVSLVDTSEPGEVILPVVSGNFTTFSGTSGALADLGYLPTNAAKTKVVMANAAVIANHIATFTDTSGTLDDDATTAINGGNIAAGLSGTAGELRSYPTTGSKGYLAVAAIDNTGDTAVTISNALHGQATVVSIPDSGQATTEFLLADSSGTQNITSGNLQVDAGNIIAGSDANAGYFETHPATTLSGTLRLAAVDSSADVAVTISNADHAQATVISIPDSGQATTEFIIADSAGIQHITSGSLEVDAGNITAGMDASAGTLESYPATTISGKLVIAAADNATGDFDTTISNSTAVAQDQVISIPDSGAATSNFVLTDTAASTQSISTGISITGAANNVQTTGGGNLIAGSSGAAGSVFSYPATALRGSLELRGVDNVGDTDVTISNASHGQATTVSIPDGGQATANFIISESAGTQTIATGSLALSAGNVTATTGNMIAGSDANAGYFESHPATTVSGTLRMTAVDNAADVVVTVSNASHGQATVISIPDSGQATTEFILADSAATQNITSGNLTVDAGIISSGLTGGGVAGKFVAWANTASNGSVSLLATDNGGDFDVIITNGAHGQDTTYSITDIGEAAGSILVNVLDAADPNSNIVTFDITVGQAALAAAGTVTLQASSGSKQYKIRSLYLNGFGTNFSGGGGDRLATISDGTTAFSVIPAATLQSLANARWGESDLPYPASAAINTSTAAGAALTIAYSGGTTDYTAGSMVITGVLERVA